MTTWYTNGLDQCVKANVDWINDTIKLALVADTYTPDQDVHDFWDDVSANEVSGTGYTAGGQALASKATNIDGVNHQVEIRAADVTWASSTITARYGVIYKDTGAAGTSPLLAYIDFGSNKSSDNGDFTVDFDQTEGVLRITAS